MNVGRVTSRHNTPAALLFVSLILCQVSLNDEEHLSSNHKKHSYLAKAAQNLTGEDDHSASADRRREVVRSENEPKTNKMVKIKPFQMFRKH